MNDWITYRLSGQFVTNPSNAGVMQLLDVRTGAWCESLCGLVAIHPDQLSILKPAGMPIGMITPEASEATGLPASTLLVNGGHDQSCTALALGITNPGQTLLACGTSWVFTDVVKQSDVSSVPAELDLNYHAVAERWTISQSLGGLGASLDWLVRQCWQYAGSTDMRYSEMDHDVAAASPGSNGLHFLPMSGGHAAPAGNQHGGFVNMRLSHTRADLARAVMEGAAYELRIAMERVQQAGIDFTGLWMVGGATRSRQWPGIVAAVIRLPICLTPSAQLPAVGAAMLAGYGAGIYPSLSAAQAAMAQPVVPVESDVEEHLRYEASYASYLNILHTGVYE